MGDLSWLAQEARQVHAVFESLFYGLVTTLLLLGLVSEYFKWPLGGVPSFGPLIGRVLIAAFLLHTYTDVTNLFAEFTDGLAIKLGDLNKIKMVLDRMGEKLGDLTWSWVSVKDSVTLLLSFVTFFVLYFSVHVANAFILYTWTLLYVFSPLLIALFVIPATSGATKALYRSIIEVSAWKVVWSVLATLVWSAALSEINKPANEVSFLTAICFNLILAGSLLLTPVVVHSLAGAGLSSVARTIGGIAVGATMITPSRAIGTSSEIAKKTYGGLASNQNRSQQKYFSKINSSKSKNPIQTEFKF